MTSKKWKGREFTVAVKAVRASICSLRVHRREKSLKFRSTFGDDSASSLAVTKSKAAATRYVVIELISQ